MLKPHWIKGVLDPMLSRVGTATASGFVAYGMAENHATVVGSAVAIVVGFALDLALRKFLRG